MDKKPVKKSPAIHAPEEVDSYLANLPEDIRLTLEEVRTIVKELVPEATERVSYGIPIVRLNKDLVGFGYTNNHCSFYTMSPGLAKSMKDEFKGYKVSGATIHFTKENPLNSDLIEKIVTARIAEMK